LERAFVKYNAGVRNTPADRATPVEANPEIRNRCGRTEIVPGFGIIGSTKGAVRKNSWTS
jgi:hypothetical protein